MGVLKDSYKDMKNNIKGLFHGTFYPNDDCEAWAKGKKEEKTHRISLLSGEKSNNLQKGLNKLENYKGYFYKLKGDIK